uniref:Uncharacterized protein n=1 Tax=Scleropages formosus TaxID=113540 RepID=A0A8C9V4T1_SCLFO
MIKCSTFSRSLYEFLTARKERRRVTRVTRVSCVLIYCLLLCSVLHQQHFVPPRKNEDLLLRGGTTAPPAGQTVMSTEETTGCVLVCKLTACPTLGHSQGVLSQPSWI